MHSSVYSSQQHLHAHGRLHSHNPSLVKQVHRGHVTRAQQQQQQQQQQLQQAEPQQQQELQRQRLQQQQQEGSNPLVTSLVSVMTESLRLLGIGRDRYKAIASQPPPNPPLGPGMTQELVDRLTDDFQRAYFVTGLIDDSIYDPNCRFVDPTVNFAGVDLWKRNLQLLVPFLVQPNIKLHSTQIRQTQSPPEVEAAWQLTTWLALPWQPYVDIQGRTVYTLNQDANQIMRHEEFWNVSPVAAILMLLKPGPPVPDQ